MDTEIRSYEQSVRIAYLLNSSIPSLNLCVNLTSKYRGPVYAPSFDMNQSIKVLLDIIGLISVNKVYMSSPTMLDPQCL